MQFMMPRTMHITHDSESDRISANVKCELRHCDNNDLPIYFG